MSPEVKIQHNNFFRSLSRAVVVSTREVIVPNPDKPYEFPCKATFDRLTRTIEGRSEVQEDLPPPILEQEVINERDSSPEVHSETAVRSRDGSIHLHHQLTRK